MFPRNIIDVIKKNKRIHRLNVPNNIFNGKFFNFAHKFLICTKVLNSISIIDITLVNI